MNSSAWKNAFQFCTTLNSTMMATIAWLSGRAMLAKKRVFVQPSICADSRSSSGTLLAKNVRATIRLKTLTALGRISAHAELFRPRRRTTT